MAPFYRIQPTLCSIRHADLFHPPTIHTLTHHWNALLHTTLHHPDTPITNHQPTTHPHPTHNTPPPPQNGAHGCLHERFAVVAARHAGSVAVEAGSERLDYATLEARSSRLARRLAALGVRRGDLVGLLATADATLVVAILGILKAGAAYVPVDPRDPDSRKRQLLADAGVCLVVGDDPVRGLGCRVVSARADRDPVDTLPALRPTAVGPEDRAYVIYTSGSTGAPKGVEVSHANVTALLDATSARFGFGPTDVWTMFHSAAFDFAVWEMWGALRHGGRLVIVTPQTARSPAAFVELLAERSVTVVNQTPLAFAQLVDALRQRPVKLSLHTVIIGGAVLEPDLVRRWFSLPAADGTRLYNMYGTTETTVHATVHEIAAPSQFTSSIIGMPLPHLSATVHGPSGERMPTGVPGELWIGGAGVATGYLRRPDLTASRFTPDPTSVDGRRIYRTGDRVRVLPDGTLEILGRLDDQVKVRGYRVELGEVAAILATHPQVRESSVVFHDDAAGGRLVAYAAVRGEVTEAGLREYLAGRLPEYMLPALIVLVDGLPRTVGGKVDRAALPAPSSRPVAASGRYVAPRTAAEQTLAAVWSEVLEVERIGLHDNIFELRGDSIRSMMILARLAAHGWTLRIEDLFANPTLAGAAAHLRPAASGPARAVPEAFTMLADGERSRVPTGVLDAYPMTATQLAMIYHMELEPRRRPYHNVTSYRIRGGIDPDVLRDVVSHAVARHAILRTSFDLTRFSEPMQLVWAHAANPLIVHNVRGRSEGAQRDAIVATVAAERSRPFSLSEPPLLRIHLHLLSEDEYQLTFVDHHAILDGWSFTSLVAELLTGHHAHRTTGPGARLHTSTAGPATGLAAGTGTDTTVGEFVAAERRAVADPTSAAFWRDRLDGVVGRMFGEPQRAGGDFRVFDLTLADELCLGARNLASRLGISVKTVALGTHVAALAAVTGRAAVTTGLTANGRLSELGGTEVLGMFLNTLPLHVPVAASSWTGLLRRLHADETAMLAHRRVPFAHLAGYLRDRQLDVGFAFNRFHRLAALAGDVGEIVDDRIGSMPSLRWEPDYFSLTVAVIQDPTSERILLEVATDPSAVPEEAAAGYPAAFVRALTSMLSAPEARVA